VFNQGKQNKKERIATAQQTGAGNLHKPSPFTLSQSKKKRGEVNLGLPVLYLVTHQVA
jgi:hypothetical protein